MIESHLSIQRRAETEGHTHGIGNTLMETPWKEIYLSYVKQKTQNDFGARTITLAKNYECPITNYEHILGYAYR